MPARPVVWRKGNRLVLEGPAMAETVPTLLREGAAQRRDGVEAVDLAAVTDVDSAALALAFAWLRAARAAGRTIRFAHLPPAMEKLARLYEVDGFLPLVQA